MQLYRTLDIPEFEQIRSELEAATRTEVAQRRRAWDTTYDPWIKFNAPTLYAFMESRKKYNVRLVRFYLTPHYGDLQPHIDGYADAPSQIGLNWPIFGTEGTTMDWYETDPNNLHTGNDGLMGFSSTTPKNPKLLKKIETLELLKPTFVRTNVLHSVTNDKATPRFIMSFRFGLTQNPNTEHDFEDILDLTGL